jgi:uncharacterized protein YndB with AHSA1/START domain
MSTYRQQAQLDAPLEQVWRLVGDVREHTKWWPRVVNVQCDGLEQGCDYRQVTKTPTGRIETTMCVEELDDGRQILVRCLDTGTYARWLLTEAQGGTFLDVEFGIDPADLQHRVFDMVAGKRYFRRWLEQSVDGLRQASGASRAQARGSPPPRGGPPPSTAPAA